jgi:hypothetical protein
LAWETGTKYGIRAECCGMWSWHRAPLADAATHELRKKIRPLMTELEGTIPAHTIINEMMKRAGLKGLQQAKISEMNEVTARKALAALEDIVMDIMAGNDPLKGKR